jgi:SAM-dependent methyltransferase
MRNPWVLNSYEKYGIATKINIIRCLIIDFLFTMATHDPTSPSPGQLALCRFGSMSYLKDEKRFNPLETPGGKAIALWAEDHLKPDLKILEIGCGTGSLSCYLSLLGAQVVGVDIDPVAIKTALQNRDLTGVNGKFYVSNLFSSLKKEKFDCILFHPPIKKGFPENINDHRILAGPHFEYFTLFWQKVGTYVQGPKLIVSSVQVPRPTLQVAKDAGWELLQVGPPTWFSKSILKP